MRYQAQQLIDNQQALLLHTFTQQLRQIIILGLSMKQTN